MVLFSVDKWSGMVVRHRGWRIELGLAPPSIRSEPQNIPSGGDVVRAPALNLTGDSYAKRQPATVDAHRSGAQLIPFSSPIWLDIHGRISRIWLSSAVRCEGRRFSF